MSERLDFVRHDEILRCITDDGRVTVTELSERLGVSTVTIRKDLAALEQRSLLRRVRGGALAAAVGDEGAFSERLRRDSTTKRALARRAAARVSDGDVIAIDSSTTGHLLAQELLERRELVVVTYGMRTAMLFMDHSDATVIMPGGTLRRASGSMVGAFGSVLDGLGRIGTGFFGVTSLSRTSGLLEISHEEAETKRAIVRSCDSVVALFASSKIDGFGLHSFAAPSVISSLITDDGAHAGIVDEWASDDVTVERVSVNTGRRAEQYPAPTTRQHPTKEQS